MRPGADFGADPEALDFALTLSRSSKSGFLKDAGFDAMGIGAVRGTAIGVDMIAVEIWNVQASAIPPYERTTSEVEVRRTSKGRC